MKAVAEKGKEPETIVARVPRSVSSEIRLTLKEYKGKRYLDVRLWYVGAGASDFAPSSKGCSIPEESIAEVVAALVARGLSQAPFASQ